MTTVSRKTNEAIALYRKIVLREHDLDSMKERLAEIVVRLPSEELNTYVTKTNEIERAVTDIAFNSRERGLGASTTRQRVHAAANDAGRTR